MELSPYGRNQKATYSGKVILEVEIYCIPEGIESLIKDDSSSSWNKRFTFGRD